MWGRSSSYGMGRRSGVPAAGTPRTPTSTSRRGGAADSRLGRELRGRTFVAVLCSPRQRALRTAELAGLTDTEVDDDLAEWNYGEYEGLTTSRSMRRPDWSLWTDGCPGGESPDEVGVRLDRVLARVRPLLADGDVASSATATRCGWSPPAGSGCPPPAADCSDWTRRRCPSWASSMTGRSSSRGTCR